MKHNLHLRSSTLANKLLIFIYISTIFVSKNTYLNASQTYKIDDTHWISLGAGIRSSLESTEIESNNETRWRNNVYLDNARVYVNSQINRHLKLEVNSDCVKCGNGGELQLLDAIGKLEFNPTINFWLGRMLVPGERRELNGPFYSGIYQVFSAGTPFEPADFNTKIQSNGTSAGSYGRDDGLTLWGSTFNERLQYSVGFFRGLRNGANSRDNAMYAQRIAYNFWQVEKNPGYYTSGTYYGKEGDILTLGVNNQYQQKGAGTQVSPGDFRGTGLDVLLEKILPNKAVITLEGDYKNYEISNGYNQTDRNRPCQGSDCGFAIFEGQAYDISGMYLFPQKIVFGQFQPYIRYVNIIPNDSTHRNAYQTGINYVIDGHNSIFSLNYIYGDLTNKGITNFNSSVIGNNTSTIILGAQWQI